MYLVLLEELVDRHLRTNPLDKYGVLLAHNINLVDDGGRQFRSLHNFFFPPFSLYVYNVAINSKTHTSSNVSGMNRMWQTIVEYTHPLIYTHHFGKAGGKKNDCKASLIRETFKGTNITFSFFLSLTYLLYADLAQPELKA